MNRGLLAPLSLGVLALTLTACTRPSAPATVPDGYVTKAELEGVHKRLDSLERAIGALLEMKETLRDIRDLSRETVTLLDSRQPPPPPPPRRPTRPDPAAVYSVPVDGSPFVGPANAKITIVKSFEFACPFCDRVRPTLDELRKRYGKDLRIVYKHYIVHPDTATVPAHAACAAAKQGKFAPMYEAIFTKGFQQNRELGRDKMLELARSLRLKMRKFKADMDSQECKDRVINDQAAMAKIGVRGTPAFFINGRFLSGAQPVDRFTTVIDEELAKATQAIAAGTPQKRYYESIVAAGKTSL